MRVQCNEESDLVWRLTMGAGASEDILIDAEGIAELSACLDRAEASATCRVLVLGGARGVFCRGMDLHRLIAGDTSDAQACAADFARCLLRMRQSRQLIVALVDGEALGGGLGLLAATDLVIATENSQFALPELVLGILPAIILPVLRQRLSAQEARRLAYMGTMSAAQVQSMGLVDQVVVDAEALNKALRRTLKRLLRLHQGAVADYKILEQESARLSLEDALVMGAKRTASSLLDSEHLAAISRFLQGESPPWFARYNPPQEQS